MCLCFILRELGKTFSQVQSTAHLREAERSDRRSHGIPGDRLLALPIAWNKYWLPQTSLFAEQEVLAPSLRSFAKMEN